MNVSNSNNNDLAIVLSFPDNWAKYHSTASDWLIKTGIAKQQYYHVGHAAILLVKRDTGNIEYFDFGRYTTGATHGRVRSKHTDPILSLDIKAEIDADGNIINIKDIILLLDSNKHYTHGHGKVLYAVCKNLDFNRSKNLIHTLSERCISYSPFSKQSSNCSRFVRDILIATCNNKQVVRQLINPATFTPTPTGNVLNATVNHMVHQYENGKFSSFFLSRKKERKQMILNLLKSSTLGIDSKNLAVKEHLAIPPRHKTIPSHAQWLGGIGEGAWISITQSTSKDHIYTIARHDENGQIAYQIESKLLKLGFQVNRPFAIDYNTNRLVTTVIQNDTIYKIQLVKAFDINKEQLLPIAVQNDQNNIQ